MISSLIGFKTKLQWFILTIEYIFLIIGFTMKLISLQRICCIFLLLTSITFSQQLRGTWIARNDLTTKATLAAAMDSLAANNFNVVYINCWSRGYPLWQSQVFFQETGVKIDPTYGNRDILAEAIAEGHRVGLLVEAWFEYGFVGGWTGNVPVGQKGPIFNTHPDWVAKKSNGTEMDGSNFYWMSHTNPAAQNFLIAMATEIARNYDIDGIELDRIRYSSLEYGYDDYTVNLYKSEHGGSAPPSSGSDASWMRWRADKLNQFAARAYDSIKAINTKLTVSNAPGHYSSSSYSAYNSFLQDWMWWVDNNKVDYVSVQMYVTSATTFSSYIDYALSQVTNDSKVFPSLAIIAGGNTITDQTLTDMLNATTNKGLSGNAFWYYTDLISRFPYIKKYHYSSKTHTPFAPANWRENYAVTPHTDATNAVKTGSWIGSASAGYSGNSIYTNSSAPAAIDYYATVPVSGIYEVYLFTVVSSNRTTAAQATVFHAGGSTLKSINQTLSQNERWYKLGDFSLSAGRNKIVTVSNNGLTGATLMSADAVMIVMNRAKESGTPLPVELTSFTSEVRENEVTLLWNTATEINNYGFEIERANSKSSGSSNSFETIGFVRGSGNSNEANRYQFLDKSLVAGTYLYRLKQIDVDGTYDYSDVIEATVNTLPKFELQQNYPNPFNPSTTIEFSVESVGKVNLRVYNILGKEVSTLVDSFLEPGNHKITFDGSQLPSGVYYYSLTSSGKVIVNKMQILK